MLTSTALASLSQLFRNGQFVQLWLIGICRGVSQWLEMLVAGIFAFEVTGSPFMVAALFIARLVPLIFLGSVIGTFAERQPPRMILLVGFSFATTVSALVFMLLGQGIESYWIVLAASVASGMVWSIDMPVRRRIVGDIAGKERIVAAMSLDSASTHATRMIGPLAGGLIYQLVGPAGAYALAALLYLLALIMVVRLRAGAAPPGDKSAPPHLIGQLREGFAFSLRNKDVLRFLLITIAFNVWGLPFLTMIPVIGEEQLHLTPAWIGILAALEGAGAFVGALCVATALISINQRRLYFFGTVFYVAFAFAAGFMVDLALMGLVLFCVGLSVAGFSSMQSTLVYTIAPPEMRSRLFGLLVICIGAGLIGVVNIGLMGEWLGGAGAVRLTAAEGLIVLAVVGFGWRQLWQRTT